MVAALFITVLLASLLGSMHCAGMCGAFVLFAVGMGDEQRPSATRLHAAYHLGRLATYVLLGVAAGVAGNALDLGGAMVGINRVAAMLAGITIAMFGVAGVLASTGVRVPKAKAPRILQTALMHGHQAAAGMPPIGRALATGLLTTLLPCGWLYAFVAVAAGTASPALGALVMAAFWIGTVPALLAVGVGFRTLFGRFGRRLPLVASFALVIVGVSALVWRVDLMDVVPTTYQRIDAQGGVIPGSMGDVPSCHDGP
jgi:sulfite exporter TauE/SafE